MQYLYLRYRFEQVPSAVGEECDAEVEDIETPRCD